MILQRYIATNLLRGWLLVLLVLAAVFGLTSFIQELERTRFDYDALAVARYTLLTLPQQLVSLAPVIALLGSIVALASMDRYNELTIVSCAGVPRARLLRAIAIPTVALMATLWVCMEYVTPNLHQNAEQQRHALRYRNDVRIPDGGVWSRNGRRYIHLGKMHEGGVPGDIDLYEFNELGQLSRALHARTAIVSADRRWLLQGVREKRLVDGKMQTRGMPELEIENLWAAAELPTLILSKESMTLSVLYSYSQFRASNGRPMLHYLGTFWQKLMMPLTVAAMVLLATPLSANLGSRRDRNFGFNMGLGALIGVLFYLGAEILFALGRLLNLSIPLVAAAPALLIFSCACLLLHRMRW
ncbi:MAG: LPS export ABC transporter permease LptG [Halieaceae bacterium]